MASSEVRCWLRSNERRGDTKRNGKRSFSAGVATNEICGRAEQYGMKSGKMPQSKSAWEPKARKVSRKLQYQGNGVWS